MIRIEHSVRIRAPPGPVFELATDYEAFPSLMPGRFLDVRVRSRRGQIAVVEERIRIAGRTLHMLARHEAVGTTHSVAVLGGPARGSTFSEEYLGSDGGTVMRLEALVRLRGIFALARPFAGGRIRREITSGAEEFAAAAESRLGL